jgi:hypothetical protein
MAQTPFAVDHSRVLKLGSSAVTSSVPFDPKSRHHTVLMSFGYSVGDFIALGTLAWSVYQSCKGAPESFNNISLEVLSLHAVIKEAEETIFAQPLITTKQKRLKAVGDGCYHVLAGSGQSLQEIPESGDTEQANLGSHEMGL